MKAIRILALGAALVLAACSKPAAEKAPAPTAAGTQPPLVTVNQAPISNELYEQFAQVLTQGKPVSELSPEDREQIRDRLVRMELIAQQAEKDGLTDDPEVAARLKISRLDILQRASAQKYLKDRPPTEAELRAEFETQLSTTPLVEYHARHILVSGEDVALKVIDQLKNGANFADLAKRLSNDKASAVKGGDLGWFSPNDMPKSFADAIALLKNGDYTRTPVQSSSGWHVVQLIATRDRAPPTFDAVQDQLRQIVQTKKFLAYSDGLIRAATITPPLKNPPAPASAPVASDPADPSTPGTTPPASPPPAD